MSEIITPLEAKNAQLSSIPEWITNRVNDLLTKRFNNREIIIRQDEVLEAKSGEISKETIFENSWLDFEDLYRKAGWHVEYDKPAYNESYKAFWRFSPKEKVK